MLKHVSAHLDKISTGFDLFAFMSGQTLAEGVFEDRFGRVKRRFTVAIDGHLDGERLTLDEQFHFDDGAEESRTWILERGADGTFSGICGDAVRPARGVLQDDHATMSATLRIAVAGRQIALDFDDAFYPIDDVTLLNRSRLSKWGVRVGQVLIVFRKL